MLFVQAMIVCHSDRNICFSEAEPEDGSRSCSGIC
jgi:hypothetical protein